MPCADSFLEESIQVIIKRFHVPTNELVWSGRQVHDFIWDV